MSQIVLNHLQSRVNFPYSWWCHQLWDWPYQLYAFRHQLCQIWCFSDKFFTLIMQNCNIGRHFGIQVLLFTHISIAEHPVNEPFCSPTLLKNTTHVCSRQNTYNVLHIEMSGVGANCLFGMRYVHRVQCRCERLSVLCVGVSPEDGAAGGGGAGVRGEERSGCTGRPGPPADVTCMECSGRRQAGLTCRPERLERGQTDPTRRVVTRL